MPRRAAHISRSAELSTDGLAQMRRFTIAEYLAGALMAAIVLFGPDPDRSDHRAVAIIASIDLAMALAALLVRRPRAWMMRVAVVVGILVIGVGVATSRPLSGVPFFYLWPILSAAYFLPRRDLVWSLALMLGTFAPALTLSNADARPMLYITVSVTVVMVGVVVAVLRDQLERAMATLRHTATTDELTGLPNRGCFNAAFEREAQRAAGSDRSLTVVLLDLDHFKAINDRFGHIRGDEALRRFAGLLGAEPRGAGDIVARIGGEEFGALLVGADAEQGRRFAERLAERLRGATVDDAVTLSFSAGVASLDEDHPAPAEMLVAADRCLYAAKAAGRQRAIVVGDEILGTPLAA
jgi:diguanylate cyclase (GGDEF)-like protein